MHPGLFITLEGGEGVGKSTQARMLARRVAGLGWRVETTREPGATLLGSRLRELVSSPGAGAPAPLAELMIFMADRAQHVERLIAPSLAKGMAVISDRFADSSEVYQGRARGLGWERVRRLNELVCGDTWPRITVVLDLDPAQGLARAAERQDSLGLGLDRLEAEGAKFHGRVRQGFLDQAAAEPERIRVVDAGGPPEVVAAAVWAVVEPLARELKHAS